MDIGDFLNIILMFLVISFTLIVTYKLAFLNMKYLTSLNPFLVYQIAVTLNYFSSNVGNFEAIIKSPGTELVEYRISSYSKSFLGYYPTYVSSGVCEIRNHLEEIAFDALNAIFSTFFVGKVFGKVESLHGTKFLKEFLKVITTETVKAYAISKAIEGAFALISIFGSRSGKNIREMMVQAFKSKSLQMINLANLAEEAKKDFTNNFPSTFTKIASAGLIRVLVSKALSTTGFGGVIAFALNFAIELSDNIVSIVQGVVNIEYNCLYSVNQFGSQVIFYPVERIEYSPNLNINLKFMNVVECNTKLSDFQENKLYKITGYQPCNDDKAYLLTNISIKKNEIIDEIEIKANYDQIKKKR